MVTGRPREAGIGENRDRYAPFFACEDIFAARPWIVELRRASPVEPCSAPPHVKKRLGPATRSGLEDVLGHGRGVHVAVINFLGYGGMHVRLEDVRVSHARPG